MDEAGELPKHIPYSKLVNTKIAKKSPQNNRRNMNVFLHVDHVTHTYFSLKEKTTAVKDIHFQIEKGISSPFSGRADAEKQHSCPFWPALSPLRKAGC